MQPGKAEVPCDARKGVAKCCQSWVFHPWSPLTGGKRDGSLGRAPPLSRQQPLAVAAQFKTTFCALCGSINDRLEMGYRWSLFPLSLSTELPLCKNENPHDKIRTQFSSVFPHSSVSVPAVMWGCKGRSHCSFPCRSGQNLCNSCGGVTCFSSLLVLVTGNSAPGT